jgi:hypothetical protein
VIDKKAIARAAEAHGGGVEEMPGEPALDKAA